jgi:hypothetical protein
MPDTGTSYQSGDTVKTAVRVLSMGGPETEQDFMLYYGGAVNATLRTPSGTAVTFALENTSNTSVSTLADGTVNSCWDNSPDDYIDMNDDIIPSPIPQYFGGALNYNLTWTCDAATCPAYSGVTYPIYESNEWSWGGLDYFGLTGWDECTGWPGAEGSGWTFDVSGETTEYFWYGNYTLATEGGTWTATGNASADYFFTNDTGRTFSVTGTAAAATPSQGGAGLFRNITLETKNNITIEAGVSRLTLARGTSEPVTVRVKNIGSVVLTDVFVGASGVPPGWATITPSSFDSLGQGETKTAAAVVTIPDTAATGKYTLMFDAHNYFTRTEYPLEITVTGRCEPCPAPGAWGWCINSVQSRTNYRCGEQTDYKCEQWTEQQGCTPPEIMNNAPLFAVMIALGAAVLLKFYWKK